MISRELCSQYPVQGLVQAEDAEVTEAMTKLGAIGEKSASPSRERSLKDEAHDSSLSQRSTTIETECNASAQPRVICPPYNQDLLGLEITGCRSDSLNLKHLTACSG